MTSRTPSDASIVPVRTQGEAQANQAQGPELFVLDSVDGLSSIAELAMMLAMSEEDVLQIIGRLASKNLVQWDAADAEPDSAADDEPVQTFRFVMTDDEIDTTDAPQASAEKRELPPPPTPRRSLQKTVEQSAVDASVSRRPSSPPPLPPDAADEPASQRNVVKTPRHHLDTSWWRSTGRTEEPDEKLTSREISNSGLRFAPSTSKVPPAPTRPPEAKETAQHDVITDRVEPITATETSDKVIDEVAHTRGGESPLLPDLEYDEDWDPAEGAAPTHPWDKEPIAESLKGEERAWSQDALRCVSYYLRLIEHGTYYDIFAVPNDASTQEIETSARRAQQQLQLDILNAKASAEGRHALQKVQSGMARALDVLKNDESRAQYDAALEALAAFKLG